MSRRERKTRSKLTKADLALSSPPGAAPWLQGYFTKAVFDRDRDVPAMPRFHPIHEDETWQYEFLCGWNDARKKLIELQENEARVAQTLLATLRSEGRGS